MMFMIVADRHKEMTIMDTAINNYTEVAIRNRVGFLLHKDSANMSSARDNDTEVAIKTQRDRYIQIVWIVPIVSCVYRSHRRGKHGIVDKYANRGSKHDNGAKYPRVVRNT